MIAKDIGWLLANTGIDKNSVVLEAGSGSGMLTVNLARFCKKIISYEKNEDFFKIASKNVEMLGLNNVAIKNKDINDGVDEKGLDACVLDMLDPWNSLGNVYTALKSGGYLVTYVTNVNQLSRLVEELDKNRFMHIKTAEIIEREWHVEGLKVRPKSSIIGHTGFLTIARKI
jgi:tRNA (adenine57-N1/adenine58-N1)-methyltransferase